MLLEMLVVEELNGGEEEAEELLVDMGLEVEVGCRVAVAVTRLEAMVLGKVLG